VKGERRIKQARLIFSSEPHPILCKDSERREKNKASSLVFSSEPHPTVYKKFSTKCESKTNYGILISYMQKILMRCINVFPEFSN
jgi:hypothetical protein